MRDEEDKIKQYRACMKMYGSMAMDLAESGEYLRYLICGEGLSDFENGLRNMIEESMR